MIDEVASFDGLEAKARLDRDSLAFHAPLGLTEGAWLQRVARPDNGHRAAVAELFAGYLALLGREEAESPAAAYRGALARAGCALPPVTTRQFSLDPRIGLPALRFASLRLELGLQAGRHFPELIGFSLGYAGSHSPWRLLGMEADRRRAVLDAFSRHAAGAMKIHLAQFSGREAVEQWQRIRRGVGLYRQQECEYLLALDFFAEREFSMEERVAAIFRRKAEFARGYHRKASLGGRSLDDWFAQEPFDAAGFLQAFDTSMYASGTAGERPFDRLTGFGGPMFGIFSREELALIGAWLDAPKGDSGAVGLGMASVPCHPAAGNPRRREGKSPDANSLTLESAVCGEFADESRRLFHQLVDIDRFSAAADGVRTRIESVLHRARRGLRTQGALRERFFEYSPEALSERVATIHRMEVARYRPFSGSPKLEREEYIFGIRQFAPAILVDGCWLQRACSSAQQDDRLHRLLFHIYADELGAGKAEWNHPNVYRKLLQDLGIELPDVSDAAFARDPGFLDAAFDLPVYLLGISLFPDRWLPELLGLNLAIELSGLGAQYLSLADELEHWGLNSLIVRLHLSIDSLAGGHSALAVEAVQIYLERIRALGGEATVAEHWRRVWCGYLSLGAATRRFKWVLSLAFCRRFLPGRLIRRWRKPG